MTPEDKLMTARCRLLTVEPWYGHMAMMMRWVESSMSSMPESSRTMGVRVMKGGRVECIWYRKFVEEHDLEELYGVIQHEIEHLVRVHCTRRSKRQPYIWNLACDMTVNGTCDNPRIGYHSDKIVLPLGPDSKDNMIWIPREWPTNETADYYYERIMKDSVFKWARKCAADGEFYPGGMLDNHDLWDSTDATPEEIRQIISGMAQNATARAAGRIPGHLATVLGELGKPLISWYQVLKQYMGRHLGGHRKTYSRRDRRNDVFGSIGVSRHAAAKASIIIDTSGSITDYDLSQFFAEIETICYRAKVCLLQWDHGFQDFDTRYRRGDWKKITIKGRGGTDMAAPVEWLYERGLVGDLCIMLTDGFCNYTSEKPFPMVTCITTGDGEEPNWGKVLRMNPHRKDVKEAAYH